MIFYDFCKEFSEVIQKCLFFPQQVRLLALVFFCMSIILKYINIKSKGVEYKGQVIKSNYFKQVLTVNITVILITRSVYPYCYFRRQSSQLLVTISNKVYKCLYDNFDEIHFE